MRHPFSYSLLLFSCLFGFSLCFAQKNTYQVVINHEEQYAIWGMDDQVSNKWKSTEKTGSLTDCMRYIEEVWTDMRPLSIRKKGFPGSTRYQVIINHEEQYAIWPAADTVPKRWRAIKKTGSLAQCQAYIEEVWTDMRPLSLRKR